MMQKYQPKALIDGSKIDLDPNSKYVAVPDKFAGKQITVIFGDTAMIIKDWKGEALQFKRFRDKFWKAGSNRPQHYTLGYFKFKGEQ
jgi:hypothetical protein